MGERERSPVLGKTVRREIIKIRTLEISAQEVQFKEEEWSEKEV